MSAEAPEPWAIAVDEPVVGDLRERLARAVWPPQPEGDRWEFGSDLGYARELCDHWRESYDFSRLERLNDLGSVRWDGLHALRVAPDGGASGPPVVMLHGWPSGPIEYERAAALVVASGRGAIVPSLPGYAWSSAPPEPLDVAGTAARLRELIVGGLGIERFSLAGGDWGAMLAARIAYEDPARVAALHVSSPHTLPVPGDLAEPALSAEEGEWVERARRWQRRHGHHMSIQGLAPDAISAGLSDSPGGLAAYLIGKYRAWSDCGGDVETRFSKDDLCDFLTMFWSTGSIASSMRLYWAERRARWRLEPGERIGVPSAIAAYREMSGEAPGQDAGLNPPRAWSERLFTDLRRWTEMPAGGHFAAFEEPEAYTAELVAFLDDVGA